MSVEVEALMIALSCSDGSPVPTDEEFAECVLQQLRWLGYAVVDVRPSGAVYGIRPHAFRTPEEDALARRLAEQMPPPVIPPELES